MRFVTLINFTPQGMSGIGQTTQRAEAFTKAAAAGGVNIQELLWTQGPCDGVIMFEAPDAETASAAMLNLAANGNVQTQTMVAFDSSEMDSVLSKMN